MSAIDGEAVGVTLGSDGESEEAWFLRAWLLRLRLMSALSLLLTSLSNCLLLFPIENAACGPWGVTLGSNWDDVGKQLESNWEVQPLAAGSCRGCER